MRLDDFEQEIDPVILQRGRQYYEDGRVVTLSQMDSDHWTALVEGSELYQVALLAGEDGHLEWDCDCPYDKGPVCKHVVALLVALTSQDGPPPDAAGQTQVARLRAALDTLTEQERYDLLLRTAVADRELAQLILARYGPLEEEDKHAHERLVAQALDLGRDPRYRFLDYQGARQAARAVNELLHRAATLREQGRLAQALSLYQAVLEGVVEALGAADDSTGALGGCAERAMMGLQEVAEVLPPGEQEAFFAYCLATAPEEPLVGWDWGWDLLYVAGEMLVQTAAQQEALFAAFDRMAAHYTDGWMVERSAERAALLKLAVIRRREGDAAAQAFMEAQLQHVGLRQALAQFYIEQGDLAAARRLCQEWLAHPPEKLPGLVAQFRQILLDVATLEGDEEEQIRLNERLFLDSGRFEYFYRLKELLGQEQWLVYRPGFLRRLQEEQYWRVDLGALCVAEEMWEGLLGYVKLHPEQAGRFHKELAPHYPHELSQIYEQVARRTLEREMNRGAYQQVCAYLQAMQKLGQEARVAELVAEFRVTYKSRRALREELAKAFGEA